MIRVILQSTENGENEFVRFIPEYDPEYDVSAEDFLLGDCSIDMDVKMECPVIEDSSFPLNYDLKRM